MAAITIEILAATASYSAKFLNPFFFVAASSSAWYLVLTLTRQDRTLHLFHYSRHFLLGGNESFDVLLRELDLCCHDLR
jgi:hypothetical protein